MNPTLLYRIQNYLVMMSIGNLIRPTLQQRHNTFNIKKLNRKSCLAISNKDIGKIFINKNCQAISQYVYLDKCIKTRLAKQSSKNNIILIRKTSFAKLYRKKDPWHPTNKMWLLRCMTRYTDLTVARGLILQLLVACQIPRMIQFHE